MKIGENTCNQEPIITPPPILLLSLYYKYIMIWRNEKTQFTVFQW